MFTKAGAKFLMERNPDACLTECMIHAHCQTRVFDLPEMHISTGHPIRPTTIFEKRGACATIVSDLRDYFQYHTPFRHFNRCGVLRSKIDEAISKSAKISAPDWVSLFVVIEQETPCKVRLGEGTCYIVDQGKYFGGCEGEDTIIAIRVVDAPWPELEDNATSFVNFLLATVKIVQGNTEVIREIAGSS